jgi:chemotaxis protein methyltransferase CheR
MAIQIESQIPIGNQDIRLDEIEIRLLLEGIYQYYGYDFRDYSFPSLRRRLWNRVRAEQLENISALQEKILHDESTLQRLLLELSVTLTSLFRDPSFYTSVRDSVIPHLKTFPFIRIWHVGCSTGEEVYSLAIMLQEAGIYDRCLIYATDMNPHVLQKAKDGIYSMERMKEYEKNYLASGGEGDLSDYYVSDSQNAIFNSRLRKKVVFAIHNLAVDRVFNEFNLIFCRNVLIYFNKPLQDRVHSLLYQSLSQQGVLGLGSMESLNLTPHQTCYKQVDHQSKLFRRIR